MNTNDLYGAYLKNIGRVSTSLVMLFGYCQLNNLNFRTTLLELLHDLGEPPFIDKWPEIKLSLPFGLDDGIRFALAGHTFHYYKNNETLAPEGTLIYVIGECGWFSPPVLALPELVGKLEALNAAIAPRIADPERDSAIAKSDAYWRTKLNNVLNTLEDCNKVDALQLSGSERLALQDLITKLKNNN